MADPSIDEFIAKFQAEADAVFKKIDAPAANLTQYVQEGLVEGLPLTKPKTNYKPEIIEAYKVNVLLLETYHLAFDEIARIMQPAPTADELEEVAKHVRTITGPRNKNEFQFLKRQNVKRTALAEQLLLKAVKENRLIIPKYIIDQNAKQIASLSDSIAKFMLCVNATIKDTFAPPTYTVDNIEASIDYLGEAVRVTRLQSLYKSMLSLEIETRNNESDTDSEKVSYIYDECKRLLKEAHKLVDTNAHPKKNRNASLKKFIKKQKRK